MNIPLMNNEYTMNKYTSNEYTITEFKNSAKGLLWIKSGSKFHCLAEK